MNRYSDDEFEEIEEDIQEETEDEDREAEEEDEDEDEDNLLIHMATTLREREQDEEDQRILEAEQELNDDPDFTENELNNMEMDTDIDLPSFDEIYDVFRIHTSNTQLFRNSDVYYQYGTGLTTRFGTGLENTSNIQRHTFTGTQDIGDDIDLMCPVCHEFIDGVTEFASHLVYEHSRFFVSYTGTMYRNSTTENILNIMSLVRPPSSYSDITRMNIENRSGSNSNMRELIDRLVFNEDDDEDGDNAPSYEELLRLCEYIGYHKQGIHNIDKVSTKCMVAENPNINQDDTCIICIEPLHTKESIRKINKCSHKFCSECIEKWFEENKVCPLCKTDVDTDDTPIHIQNNENQNNENSDSVNI